MPILPDNIILSVCSVDSDYPHVGNDHVGDRCHLTSQGITDVTMGRV